MPRKKCPSRAPSGAPPETAPDALAAERGAQLAVDELVEHRVLDLEQQARRRRSSSACGVVDRDRLGAVEDLALAVGVRRCLALL